MAIFIFRLSCFADFRTNHSYHQWLESRWILAPDFMSLNQCDLYFHFLQISMNLHHSFFVSRAQRRLVLLQHYFHVERNCQNHVMLSIFWDCISDIPCFFWNWRSYTYTYKMHRTLRYFTIKHSGYLILRIILEVLLRLIVNHDKV